MPQSTTDLVRELRANLRHFRQQCEAFGTEWQHADLVFSVSLSYSRLRFSIHDGEDLYLQYTLQENQPPDIYCKDRDKTELLRKHLELVGRSGGTANEESRESADTRSVNTYLTIAESIAGVSYLCSTGDDYRPGYFSEITVQPEHIVLRQSNHMNSRSLDHKQNYSLRDLEFFIPLVQATRQAPRIRLDEEFIGDMRIQFSDRSSQNNKACGDRIREKIEEARATFDKAST